jgi:hypothetical protein
MASMFYGTINAQCFLSKSIKSVTVKFSPEYNLYTKFQTRNLKIKGLPSSGYRIHVDINKSLRKGFGIGAGVSYGSIKSNLVNEGYNELPITISHQYKIYCISTNVQYFVQKQLFADLGVGLLAFNQHSRLTNDITFAPFLDFSFGYQLPIKKMYFLVQPKFRYMYPGFGSNDLEFAKILPSIGLGLEVGLKYYFKMRDKPFILEQRIN